MCARQVLTQYTEISEEILKTYHYSEPGKLSHKIHTFAITNSILQ